MLGEGKSSEPMLRSLKRRKRKKGRRENDGLGIGVYTQGL